MAVESFSSARRRHSLLGRARDSVRSQMIGIKKDELRRGEYRNYTFRLPRHLPELTFSLATEFGCVCLYASNCSERPLPRMCQWTLLVDAEKQRSGTLSLRTSEHHCISGLYHIGIYCVADARFTIVCSEAAAGAAMAPPAATAGGILAQAATMNGAAIAASPRGQAHLQGQLRKPRTSLPRSFRRPFIDAGLLEGALSARASQPRVDFFVTPTSLPPPHEPSSSSSSSARGASSISKRPGEAHYENALGDWHKSLRDRMDAVGNLDQARPVSRGASGASAHAGAHSYSHRPFPPPSHGSPRNGTRGGAGSPRRTVSGGGQAHLTPSWLNYG